MFGKMSQGRVSVRFGKYHPEALKNSSIDRCFISNKNRADRVGCFYFVDEFHVYDSANPTASDNYEFEGYLEQSSKFHTDLLDQLRVIYIDE